MAARIEAYALQRQGKIALLQSKQAGISCAQRFDIELFLCHNWLSAQHLIGLVQTEDRHVNIFDGWKQQARDERHLNRYRVAVDAVQTPNRIQQIVLGDAKQVGVVWPRITLGTRENTDGRLAARSTDRFTETARAFKKSRYFLRHKGTFSPNTANLPAPNQLIDDAASNAHIDRGGIYCFSHCSPATLLMPFSSPLSAKRNFVGKITDLQCSTKRMSLSNSIVLS